MSGGIRSSMGPALKRLKTMIDTVIPILNKGQIGDRDVQILKLNGIKMRKVIESLEAKNAEWLNFMKGLSLEERTPEEKKYEGFKYEEKHFYEWVEKGKDVLEDIDQTEGIHEVPVQGENGNPGRNLERNPTEGVHLERVALPPFRGDPHEWPHFWQLFVSLVEKGNYAPVVKLHYLLGCLRGDAKESVQDVGISGENYQMVKDILKARFGNKNVLMEALQAELVRLPPATESPLSLKRTVDNLEKIFRQLKALGTDVDNDMMLGLIKAKLPRGILMKLAEKEATEEAKWGPKEFRESLVKYVGIQEAVFQSTRHFHPGTREKGQDSSGTRNHDRFRGNDRGQRRDDQTQTRNFQAMGVKGNFRRNPRSEEFREVKCLFCDGNHLATQCEKVKGREERLKKLADQQRCFRCLRYGHMAGQCRSTRNCPICNGSHHSVICPRKTEQKSNWEPRPSFERKPMTMGTSSNSIPLGKKNSGKAQSSKWKGKSEASRSNTSCAWGGTAEEEDKEPPVEQTENHLSIQEVMGNRPGDTILMAQKVPISSPRENGKIYEALVFFDTGSQTSYVSEKLVKKLNPPKIGEGYLEVKAFKAPEPIRFKSGKYVLELHRRDGKKEQMVLYSSGSFAKGFKAARIDKVSEESTLKEIRRNLEWINQEPDILVGVAEFWKFFVSKRDLAEEFFLIETTVGPIVCGRAQLTNAGKEWQTQTSVSINTSNEEQLPEEKTISSWWDLQTLGIKDDPNENEDEASEILFEKSIRQVDGRYRTKWLWKEDNPDLPSNYGLAFRCLESILRRLQGMPDSDLLAKYDAKIREQLEKDIIEVASRNEGTLEHYLPHHPVVTHKLRLVYNASAKVRNGNSLNECLYRGTVLLPELVGMLLRFRLPKYVLLGDIEAAFLQIELEEPDREVAKFLWVSDIHAPPTKSNLVIYRFKRVAFGVICSPFLLSATIRHHLRKYPKSELAKELWDNTYMDNLMMSGETREEILGQYTESKEIFKQAKMNVREYITNAPGIMELIPKEDQLETGKPKVLGIKWELASDNLEIWFPQPQEMEVVTRRGVLQTLSSLFDPLGILSPCVVEAKLFFQELWNLAQTWDEALPESVAQRWRTVLEKWKDQIILIPRRIQTEGTLEYQLHAFVDASKDVYAAAIYLRTENQENVEAHLVFSKNRLKSKSGNITIPRMELLAILIGVRALKFVEKELKLSVMERHLWSDSQAALSWVNLDNAETKPRFVANRLAEIRQHRDCIFHHVKSEENPADLATRGMIPEEIRHSELWWKGPKWLVRQSNEWKSFMEFTVPEQPDLMEQWEIEQVQSHMVLVETEDRLVLAGIIDLRRFSNWKKLVGTMEFVLKFLQIKFANCLEKLNVNGNRKRPELVRMTMEVGDNSMWSGREMAELVILKLAQREGADSMDKLEVTRGKDGLVKLRTRIQGSDGNPEMENPIVIPKGSPILELLILEVHVRMAHSGTESTLTEFLCTFWTPRARRKVKAVIKFCGMCRKMKAYPFKLPKMANLPADRVQLRAPFESIAIDYLGPTVYRERGQVLKVWVVLITCLCTRAVYLEPVRNLSTESFLLVFRRFVARRGCPNTVLTDNGTQFRMAAKVFDIAVRPAAKSLIWKFTKELSPWQNGVVERLVTLFKDAFRRTLGKRILEFDELNTFVAECEGIMNQRPITCVNDNPEGDSEFLLPLRPIDFIQPRANLVLELEGPQGEFPVTPAERLADSWILSTDQLESFRKRWKREYLLMLRERRQWYIKGPRLQTHRDPEVGEVVLVEENLQPRNLWAMGKVVEIQGSKRPGEIRNVKVLMPNRKILSRPISRLYPLEANSERNKSEPMEEGKEDDDRNDTVEPPSHQMVTRRKAKEMRKGRYPRFGNSTMGYLAQLGIMCLVVISLISGISGRPQGCPKCKAHCVSDGIEIFMPKVIDKVEVCCVTEGSCTTHLYAPKWVVKLPEDLLINHHDCKITFWEQAKEITTRKVKCEPSNACELITCYACWNRILNSECMPRLTAFLIGILLFSMGILLCVMLWFIRMILGNIRFCCTIFGIIPDLVFRRNRKPRGRYSDEEEDLISEDDVNWSKGRYRKWTGSATRGFTWNLYILMVIGIFRMDSIHAGTEVFSVKAETEECVKNHHGITCILNSVNTLTLLPAGQEVNLMIKDPEGKLRGNIKLVLNSLQLLCVAKTEQWLRSYKVETGSVRSCPREGSCVSTYCEGVTPKTEIPELAKWEKNPGFNHCGPSCSWGCGCTFPGSACMFWRNFAVPVTEAVYELFSCVDWVYRIEATLTVDIGNSTTEETLILVNGMTSHWENFTFTPSPIALPPTPILYKKFLADGKSAALVEKIESDLFCKDHESAYYFNCTLDLHACDECKKDEQELKEICLCRDLLLEPYFENPETSLPLETPTLSLHNKGKQIYSISQYTPIQVTLKMHQFHLAVLSDLNVCTIEVQEFSGCFRCVEGAGLNFTCSTDQGNSLAEVRCSGGTIFTAKCSENGIYQMVPLAFEDSMVEELCEVECIGGITEFELKGQLQHIVSDAKFKFDISQSIKGTRNGTMNLNWDWPNMASYLWQNVLSRSLFGNWNWVYAASGIGIGIIILFVIFKCHPFFLAYRRLGHWLLVILIIGDFWRGGTLAFSVETDQNDSSIESWNRSEGYIRPQSNTPPFTPQIFGKMEDQRRKKIRGKPAKATNVFGERRQTAPAKGKESFFMTLLCYMELLVQGIPECGTLEEIFEKKKDLWKALVLRIETTLKVYRAKLVLSESSKREVDYLRVSDQPATRQLAMFPNITLQRECEMHGRPLKRPDLPGIKERDGMDLGMEIISLKFGSWEECQKAIQTYKWDTAGLTWEETTGGIAGNQWNQELTNRPSTSGTLSGIVELPKWRKPLPKSDMDLFYMECGTPKDAVDLRKLEEEFYLSLESEEPLVYSSSSEPEPGTSREIAGRKETRGRKDKSTQTEMAIQRGWDPADLMAFRRLATKMGLFVVMISLIITGMIPPGEALSSENLCKGKISMSQMSHWDAPFSGRRLNKNRKDCSLFILGTCSFLETFPSILLSNTYPDSLMPPPKPHRGKNMETMLAQRRKETESDSEDDRKSRRDLKRRRDRKTKGNSSESHYSGNSGTSSDQGKRGRKEKRSTSCSRDSDFSRQGTRSEESQGLSCSSDSSSDSDKNAKKRKGRKALGDSQSSGNEKVEHFLDQEAKERKPKKKFSCGRCRESGKAKEIYEGHIRSNTHCPSLPGNQGKAREGNASVISSSSEEEEELRKKLRKKERARKLREKEKKEAEKRKRQKRRREKEAKDKEETEEEEREEEYGKDEPEKEEEKPKEKRKISSVVRKATPVEEELDYEEGEVRDGHQSPIRNLGTPTEEIIKEVSKKGARNLGGTREDAGLYTEYDAWGQAKRAIGKIFSLSRFGPKTSGTREEIRSIVKNVKESLEKGLEAMERNEEEGKRGRGPGSSAGTH